jgi:SAM-dependent methyltransferase
MQQDIYNNKTYLTNNPTWHEEDAEFKVKHIAGLIEQIPSEIQNLCEFGCGSGAILALLQHRFPGIKLFSGYEISSDAYAIAKAKENKDLTIYLKDITSDESAGSFQLMLIIDVIEHLENYFHFLDSLRTKSQYFIFHIPIDMCVRTLFREGILIASKNRVGHIHNFTEDFIKSILYDHGYNILQQVYTEPVIKNSSFKQALIEQFRKVLHFLNPRFASKLIGGYSIMILAEANSTHPNT